MALCDGAFPLVQLSARFAVRSVTGVSASVTGQSLFTRLQASIGGLYRELLKFGAVGAIAFVVDLSVFNLLRTGIIGGEHGLADKPLTVKTISVLVATVVAWLGNRYWTFRHRRRASRRREFVLFMLMNAGGLGIALACLGFSHYVLGLTSALADNIAGNGVGLALGTLFRFWAYRQLVFTAGSQAPPEPEHPTANSEISLDPNPLVSGAEPSEDIVLDLRVHSRPIAAQAPVAVPGHQPGQHR